MMEELRPLLADRLALASINLHQVAAGDFEERDGGAVLLSDKGRRTVLEAGEQRRQQELQQPELARPLKTRDAD